MVPSLLRLSLVVASTSALVFQPRRVPFHDGACSARATSTQLHAMTGSMTTQLNYQNSQDTYANDVSIDSGSALQDGLELQPVYAHLQNFRAIREVEQYCYPHLLSSLKTWGKRKEIKRRMKFVEMLSPIQKETFETVFTLADQDNDQLIDLFDLRAVFESAGTSSDSTTSHPKLGLKGFTKIGFNEFMGITAEAEFYHMLVETFEALDSNHSGFVRVKDVRSLLHDLEATIYGASMTSRAGGCKGLVGSILNGSYDGKSDPYLNYVEFTETLLGMRC